MIEPYDSIIVTHEYNDVCSILLLIRVYLIVRVFLNDTIYADTRASRICRLYGCESGYHYAAKCFMKEMPFAVVFVMFVTSLIIYG